MMRESHARFARAFLGLSLVAAAGCDTQIAFKNDLPGASIENVRWVAPSETYSLDEWSDEKASLGPGESSLAVGVNNPEDEGASGVVEFDLVQNGRRVFLVTRKEFSAAPGETTVFTISEDTPVENPHDAR